MPPPAASPTTLLSDSVSSLGSVATTTSTSTTPSSVLQKTFYTSNGVKLSAKSNWIAPVGAFKESCYLCSYYGHGGGTCPNINPEFLGWCYRCWSGRHETKVSLQKFLLRIY